MTRAHSFCLTETLFSLINNALFPPPSQPLAATILFSDPMNLIILDTSYKWRSEIMQYLPFWGWLISCSIMSSRCISVVQYIAEFPFLKPHVCVCVYHILSHHVLVSSWYNINLGSGIEYIVNAPFLLSPCPLSNGLASSW